MKKIFLIFIIAIITSVMTAATVQAVSLPGQVRQEARQEIREEKKENLIEKLASAPGQMIKWMNKRTVISKGTVESINGATLVGATFTITKDGKSYTVTTDANTKFLRRYWGKISDISEIQKGHIVTVVGKWKDDERTSIVAINFRDTSIQKRHGVFFGTVKTINGNTWTVETKNRGVQTITVSSSVRFLNRRNETMNLSDVAVGQRIRIRGLWDRTNNTVTEVTQVKNFDVPSQ